MTLPDERLLWRVFLGALAAGVLYRLWPLAFGEAALARFFVTEDGYLMLTVARNMALGLGMSVSEGTVPTNGVQPLATFLWSLPHLLTGGDRVASLAALHLVSAAIAVAGLFAVRAFAARALSAPDAAPADEARLWAWAVAVLWFVGPGLVMHSMNGLETGLYALMLVLTCLQFARVLHRGAAAGAADRLALGLLCGVTFLTRNDAAFFVIAVFLVWAVHALAVARLGLRGALARLVPPGLVCLVVIAPWLVNNQLNFGSIVPISGSSQALGARFGQNAPLVPVKLFEHLLPMLPVPGALEDRPAVILATGLVVAAVLAAFLVRTWRRGGPMAWAMAAYALHAAAIAAYYGLFFGAPHFMGRYFAPLAPLLILAAVTVARDLLGRLVPGRAAGALGLATLAGVALSLALLGRQLLVHDQGHFQVVDWVSGNVAASDWVGAVQTGTLGYWHDRTVNLDGKVNPEALAVLRREGHVLDYVAGSEIRYVADWVGIADWVNHHGFGRVFEVVVEDPAANLAVLRRRGPAAE